MTTPGGIAPVGGAQVGGVGEGGLTQASNTAARVAELRTLIAQVETGATPAKGAAAEGDFSAQLSAATAAGGASPAIGQATALTPSATTLPASGGRLNPSVPYAADIEAAAAKYGLDPALLAGLIKAESNFEPDVGSAAGAQGLTALMPATARSVGVQDPHNPAESVDGGAHVLREMLDKFGGNVELALAAYNAGPGAVEQHNGIPPYSETQAYVPRVLGFANEFRGGAAR